ncbi:PREDICTED: trithorax group protein osa-like [Nicrophorus vespilloides]|uniref:Trithorax group protein osa-like n=1 Tax=Nicrophorus vespilloides TaxID=110193 RepID=A0ABM1MCZ0_NICVS|nr:PREDICTED: trithorax group protein osa-like [Nicrophorus vespilloides]
MRFEIFADDGSSSRIASPQNESRQRGLAIRSAATPPPASPASRRASPQQQRRTPNNNTFGGSDGSV